MSLESRIKSAQRLLKNFDTDAMLIENPIDLFYLTQENLSAGSLLITSSSAELYVDGRYYETCKSNCSLAVHLSNTDSLNKRIAELSLKKLSIDSTYTSVQRYTELKQTNNCNICTIPGPILEIRSIKDHDEIQALQKAADLGSEGYRYLLTQIREGISERQLALKLEMFWLEQGADGLAFSPIIAFGKNSSKPHYHPSPEVTLEKGQNILIDIGVQLNGYHSDMTRVVFFDQPDPYLEKIYHIVREAQEKALSNCYEGVSVRELDSSARDFIADQGYGDRFTHGLGHGVGLEVHEYPSLRLAEENKHKKLKKNMVLTLEPGIYLPDLGGVRIEDTVVVGQESCTNLSSPSKELHIITY